MNLKEKKEAFTRLGDTTCIESDRRLLRFYNPVSGALAESGSKEKQEKEILWELLDYCGEKVIRDNRQQREVPAGIVPAAEMQAQPVLPVKKKVSTKKRSIRTFAGRTWKMKTFKKPLSSITTGLIALKRCESWMYNWTTARQKGR